MRTPFFRSTALEWCAQAVASILTVLAMATARAAEPIRIVYLDPTGNPESAGITPFRAAFARPPSPPGPGTVIERQVVPVDTIEQVSNAIAALRSKPPAVVVTAHTTIAQAVARDMPKTPLVLATVADPVMLGITDHEISQTTNVTGFTDNVPFDLKHIELLQEFAPGTRHVGVISDPFWASGPTARRLLGEAPQIFGLRATLVRVEDPAHIERLVMAASRDGVDAWFIADTPFNRIHSLELTRAITATGKPSIAAFARHARQGGLMAYLPVQAEFWPRVAEMVKLILSGVAARNIPFDRPKRFAFIVNRERARTMGWPVPRSILLRADEFIP